VLAPVTFRTARLEDLDAIIGLLEQIETAPGVSVYRHASAEQYERAFLEIVSAPHHELVVGELGGELVATLQVSYLPNLTLGAAKRAHIEGVRVSSRWRQRGIGKQLVSHAIARARARGCGLVQLTTNAWRHDVIRFYEQLGFAATHIGLRVELSD
jgi:ribosomal protein S18 acetylase RimI-like enzyme